MRLIDADELYKEICRAYEYEYPTASGAFDEFVSETLKNIIYNAPTVEAEPVRHGKWIVCGDGEYVPFMCSACGKTTSWYHAQAAKYCPNCGAKMED